MSTMSVIFIMATCALMFIMVIFAINEDLPVTAVLAMVILSVGMMCGVVWMVNTKFTPFLRLLGLGP